MIQKCEKLGIHLHHLPKATLLRLILRNSNVLGSFGPTNMSN